MCKQCDAFPKLTHEHTQSATHLIDTRHGCAGGARVRPRGDAILSVREQGTGPRTAHFTCGGCGHVIHEALKEPPAAKPVPPLLTPPPAIAIAPVPPTTGGMP